ncbi:actin-like ATPase domain-containing protein [Exidia glandulosa HHB12029]|uniref:Actin-like ATPase domain-containing protein n=1 Tax=Exidia glandulosa HHB12029 TaxID=1314781 RepID=A0A165PP16_EXIGL|nr:actin-like ATPase domain-containing protein [Exidia glandulosa HHB12029]
MSAEYEDVLTNQPVVIDNGSGTITAGFAGQDHPRCFFLSLYAAGRHTRVLTDALEGDVFIGRRAPECAGPLKTRYAMEHGVVKDWDDMEPIWGVGAYPAWRSFPSFYSRLVPSPTSASALHHTLSAEYHVVPVLAARLSLSFPSLPLL